MFKIILIEFILIASILSHPAGEPEKQEGEPACRKEQTEKSASIGMETKQNTEKKKEVDKDTVHVDRSASFITFKNYPASYYDYNR